MKSLGLVAVLFCGVVKGFLAVKVISYSAGLIFEKESNFLVAISRYSGSALTVIRGFPGVSSS